MATLSLSLLGSIQITLGEQPVSTFKSDKIRALLAYLAVEADRPHRRETLAALLWPEIPDRAARNNLRDALANLRQAIGDRETSPPFLLIERNTIQFNGTSDHWLDVAVFRQLIGNDLQEPPTHEQLAEAMALYHGDFLAGFSLKDSSAFDDWSLLTRERLQRQALLALRRLAETYEDHGEPERACDCAWRQVELEPWEEQAHRQLMRLLALDGQRGAALAQYEACRRSLAEELGAEPAAETTALAQQIRDGTLARPSDVPTSEAVPGHAPRLVGDCPYRGLAAFREKDAPYFFGRDDFARRLNDAVDHHPPVMVIVGSSGSGKSSVVAAGLLPRLRKDSTWIIAPFRPGRQPFNALAGTLLSLLEQGISETDKLVEIQKLAKALREGDLELNQVVERIREKEGGECRLLLIADQFEELYALCPDPDIRRRFLDGLLATTASKAERPVPLLVVMLSMRADFMGQALAHRPFANTLQTAALMLGPMTREELQAAIQMPAQKQGAAFEAGLVSRILDDVGEEPGNLPLLEFALTQLWDLADLGWLTHDAYDAIGGVDGALARYADQVIGTLDKQEQDQARQVFVQLVRPGEGTEDTRRMATCAELGEENWPLVQHLADKRLVVTGRDITGTEIVEVVHEALIQRWGRLRAWMDADRAFRTWQEGLRAALRQWESSNQDDGALLRGAPLAHAEEWLNERGTELSPDETHIIQESVALREAKQVERDRRRRWTLVALTGGLVIAVALAIMALGARASAEREAAVNHSLVLAANAQHAQDNGDVDLALALALEAVNLNQPPPEAVRTLSAISLGPGTRALLGGSSYAVQDVAFSPDGRTALSGGCGEQNPDGNCVQGELILWDVGATAGTESEQRTFESQADWVNAVAYSPDGKTALSGSGNASLTLWDLDTGASIRQFEGHAGGVNDVAFAADGLTALSGADDATLILWDVTAGKAIRRFEGHSAGVNVVAFGLEDQTALSASDDETLILWDLTTGEDIRRYEGHINEVVGAAFSSNGHTILSTGDHTLRLWDLKTGDELRQQHFGGQPKLFAVSPDGRTVLFDLDGLVMWDIERWQEVQWLQGDPSLEAGTESAALSPDGLLALSGWTDGSLRLWNLGGQPDYRRFETDGTPLAAVAISPDGHHLLTGDMADNTVLWDVERGEETLRLVGDAVAVSPNSVAFSPDGKRALVGSGDAFGGSGAKSLVLWDLETGEEIRRFEGHRFLLRSVAFGPGGRTALTGSQSIDQAYEGELILWDLETGEEIRRFDNVEDITSIAFSSNGNLALTGSAYFASSVLWDVASGQEINRFGGHTDMIFDVAFSPDETAALSASGDGSLILWDLETGDAIRRYLGHDDMVWSVDVSPDGRHLISASLDGTVILWDFETGQEKRRFRVHTATGTDAVFHPDSQTAYSVALDSSLVEWTISDLSLEDLIDWTHANRYVRSLTCEERVQYRVEPACE